MATAARGNIACDKGEVGLVDGTHLQSKWIVLVISYMLVASKPGIRAVEG